MKIVIVLIVFTTFICGAFSVSVTAQALQTQEFATGSLLKFKARPESGFNFEYFIFLPKKLRSHTSSYLLVETNNSGTNDSIEHQEKGAEYAASKSSVGNYVSRKLEIPLLVPIFPRSATNWTYYTHALDRDTLLSKEFGIERLDLQLLAMIADAKKQLAKQNFYLKDKFFITGFSASGTFANRFSILHAEKIRATASGGINAIAILPVAELEGISLDYPLGTADIKKITGRKANLKAFKKLPKLLYMGATDTNDAVAFDDAYSEEERKIVYELMGKQMIPQRWNFIREVYLKNNIQADFKTYPQIGHGTDLKINTDLVDFFKTHSK
jgi:hypothetical protein